MALLVIGFFVALTNKQWIKDQYIVSTTQLQPASVAVLENISLTDQATFLYKASRPEIQTSSAFTASCKNVAHEQSIVLGCYTGQRVYIYDVQDERLEGVKQVTTAHELLHAVYERMSTTERQNINAALLSTANSIEDERFKETLAQYRRTEPDQIENELHSILGTEITVLPQKLEDHYAKYFKDRKKIVAYAKQYETAFNELDSQIKTYDEELATLKVKKQSLEATLAQQQIAVETDRKKLDALRGSDPQQYNQLVPQYNAKIQSYNANITAVKQTVTDYNKIVEKRNALASTQNDLVKQLDSSYQALE